MPVIIAVLQWPKRGVHAVDADTQAELSGWTYDGLCAQMYNPGTISIDQCGSYPGAGAAVILE